MALIIRIVLERGRLGIETSPLVPAGHTLQPFQKFLPFRMGNLHIDYESGVDGDVLSMTPYKDRDGLAACVILVLVRGEAITRIRKLSNQFKIRFERNRWILNRVSPSARLPSLVA
jgi:hypothetical protein